MYTNRHSMQQYRADKLLKIRETKNSNVLNKLRIKQVTQLAHCNYSYKDSVHLFKKD